MEGGVGGLLLFINGCGHLLPFIQGGVGPLSMVWVTVSDVAPVLER